MKKVGTKLSSGDKVVQKKQQQQHTKEKYLYDYFLLSESEKRRVITQCKGNDHSEFVVLEDEEEES